MNLLKFNINFNTFFYAFLFASVFLLSSCKPDDPMRIVDGVILDAKNTVLFFSDFDYNGFVRDVSFRIKDVKKDRFPETYKINLSTINNFDGINKHIKSLCEGLYGCQIDKFNNKVYGLGAGAEYKIDLIVPIQDASSFISKIINGPDDIYLDNNIYSKTPIEADLIFYEMKLDAYEQLKDALDSALEASRGDFEKTNQVNKMLLDVNFEISSLTNTINYLKSVQNKSKIELLISKKANSTAVMVKNKSLIAFYKFIEMLDKLLLVVFFVLILKFSFWFFPWFVYFIKSSYRSLKRYINDMSKKKKKNKTIVKNDEPKPPYFQQ